jgi:EAL domain-containing protein (putative c-di-GMP-specific phosphodiesterase class I)/GGDEF domain-containing protein
MVKQEVFRQLAKPFDQRERESGSGVNVFVLVEVDDFKRVSVALGMETVELLVAGVNERVREFLRPCDQHVEISDSQCGVVLTQIQSMQHLDLAAAKLLRQFEAPIDVIDTRFHVNIFAAFVVPTKAQTQAAELFDEAERGLLEARTNGTSYAVVRPTKDEEQAPADWQNQQEIEAAFEHGEFRLFYQPKVHATYRSIVGAEALLRWASPKRGLISPAVFLPYVEQSDMLKPVTWFCIRSAAATCRNWPEHVGVAVNVAPQIFSDDEIVQVLHDALGFYELKEGRLTVEVTESAMLEDPQRCFEILDSIRDLGVKISIDDFGTGYSSLSHFRNLPAHELKIDQSFVAAMHNSIRDAALVESIVDLAHNFDLQVVAEGIEDAATADALQELGCDVLQGYYFGRPGESADFAEKLLGKPG